MKCWKRTNSPRTPGTNWNWCWWIFRATNPKMTRSNRPTGRLPDQYHVTGYPTFVLVNYAGNELGRQGGYLEGGPGAFIAELDKFSSQ